MPAEALRERVRLFGRRSVEMNPGEAAGFELSDARLGARGDVARRRARARALDAGQAWHRY
jgi:hypothetical protein